MRVIVAGSRTMRNYDLVRSKRVYYLQNRSGVEIVSGGAMGADALVERYANGRKYFGHLNLIWIAFTYS